MGLGLGVAIVYIQEVFLENQSILHLGFHLYWPAGTENRRDMRVLIAVRKDIVSGVIIKNCINLVSHPYYIVLDFKEPYQEFGKMPRRTKVVNLYNNKLGERYLWQGTNIQVQRTIEDPGWKSIIKG